MMWALREKQLCADGNVLCDSCHGTAMRPVVWWTFQGVWGGTKGLNNEMFVSPCTVHIMCCFASCHIKILMRLFWQKQKGRFLYTSLAKQRKLGNLTHWYYDMICYFRGKRLCKEIYTTQLGRVIVIEELKLFEVWRALWKHVFISYISTTIILHMLNIILFHNQFLSFLSPFCSYTISVSLNTVSVSLIKLQKTSIMRPPPTLLSWFPSSYCNDAAKQHRNLICNCLLRAKS